MAKNNNQASNLDELEAKMEQEQQQAQQANRTEASSSPEQEQQKQQETKSDYKPNEKEKHLYHVELEKPLYHPSTGEKISTPYVQKFTKNEYKQFESNAKMLGYTIKVLFNPEENLYY